MIPTLFKTALSLAVVSVASAIPQSLEIPRDLTNPEDFSWIKKFAAVGDSFTAGIGSGDLYSDNDNSYECSRYSYTYPVIINHFLGPSVESFTYSACSGAISTGISEQIKALDNDQDLVIFTAGGNDLCLSDIINQCIAGTSPSESECDAAVARAQAALGPNGYFKTNIKDLLTTLDGKMAKNGIVVQVLYAQYFNDQTDACTHEDWQIIHLSLGGLPLSPERRTQFNNLVVQTNTVIQAAVDEVAASATTMKLVTANWDPWAPIIGGQFCEPGASPDPNDPSNANVMFFKLFTGDAPELVARSDLGYMYSDNQSYGAISEPRGAIMMKRDPVDPGCPASSISIPDSIGKIFHPNDLGHEVIAAYVLDAVGDARAAILGVPPTCPVVDSQTCYSSQGSTAYASAESLNNNIDDFCSWVAQNAPTNQAGWSRSKNYYSGSLDEFTMVISLSENAAAFDPNACQAAMSKVINGCDIPSSGSNPMNWKGGGQRIEGEYTYTINIRRTNRLWPPPSAPTQSCVGWYKFLFQSYDMYGGGWATWDYGQSGLMNSITSCCGAGSLTGWTFTYYDAPDENGYEWHASFHTTIGTRRRCFDNNVVQCAAGGPCDSYCSGNG